MSVPRPHIGFSPRGWALVCIVEIVLLLGFAGLGVVLYFENQTQQSICTVFRIVQSQTQNAIDANSSILIVDLRKGNKADAKIRRTQISRQTDTLTLINHAKC